MLNTFISYSWNLYTMDTDFDLLSSANNAHLLDKDTGNNTDLVKKRALQSGHWRQVPVHPVTDTILTGH